MAAFSVHVVGEKWSSCWMYSEYPKSGVYSEHPNFVFWLLSCLLVLLARGEVKI